jgi:pantoate--beta-alanine ligase
MGNLHEGHIELVRRARHLADRVVVSVFVNPTQFGPGEDLASYPRTLEEDRRKLDQVGAELVFAPSVAEVYPDGLDDLTRVTVPKVARILCGLSRPGHFEGVALVVIKLFNMVQPDIAVFGEKDRQQLMVIERITRDLNMPVEIVGVPTVREPDGLAMSSRNAYLTPAERAVAPSLNRTIQRAAERLRSGDRDYRAIERGAADALASAGFQPDYFAVRRAADLDEPDSRDTEWLVLAAAVLGRARLIDNCLVRLHGGD